MSQKNVLMIVVDQWRGDCLPALGMSALKVPNIDSLCQEGITFRNHVTTAVPCGPARASLLTGLYLMNHRAVQNTVPLDKRHTSLPLALRACGYDPALVGYCTSTPDPRTTSQRDPRFAMLGDMMEGFRPVGSFEPNQDGYFGWLAQQGYELPNPRENVWLPEGEDEVRGATNRPSRIPASLSDTSFFTESALTYLKGRNGKPFFLHLGYWRPHPPFVASAPYHSMYKPEDMPKPVRSASPQIEAKQHKLLDFYLRKTKQSDFFQGAEGLAPDLSEDEICQMRTTYFGLMSEIDDSLGRVFSYLKENGLWENTLIIFTSDHGEQLGDHHLLGKAGYYDESFRIPLIIRDPHGRYEKGCIEPAFTESIDVMPTILEWLDGEVPRACDGRSLLPFLRGQKPHGWRTELHYEYDFRDIYYSQPEADLGVDMDDACLCVIQDENFKYVHFASLPALFFDLKADPHQFNNLADNQDYATLVRDYAQKALSWRLTHADRTLTGYRATPKGLEQRLTKNFAQPVQKD